MGGGTIAEKPKAIEIEKEEYENPPMFLTREDILGADDAMVIPVDFPEWKGKAFLRVMSGYERDELEAQQIGDRKNLVNFRARFAVKVLSDENGNRIFSDADAEALGKKCAPALDRILTIGLELNGFTASDVAELEKN
ncbi:phage tail assembly chaperone [Candidatus Pacearchaeota archaeon]|jgi:hypothetical protein|nr:phage tail assembly chaperone [Candidatus Pacearchaeota archaeon]